MSEKAIALVTALYEKSLNKSVIWDKTNSDSEFKVTLDSGVIVTTDSYTNNGNRFIDIGMYNSKGERIFYQAVTRMESISLFNTFQNLYNSARDSYFKVDETIDDILNEISTKDIVGKKIDDLDDDLPF